MQAGQIQFVRLVGTERRIRSRLAEVSRCRQGEEECLLLVRPHAAALRAGMFIQLAKRETIRRARPEEYFRGFDLALYHPANCRTMFEERTSIKMMH